MATLKMELSMLVPKKKQYSNLKSYFIASPPWDDTFQFYLVKINKGPLTSKLKHLKVRGQVILKTTSMGRLLHDASTLAKLIWFFSTGTGIAPFASMLREPEIYERFDEVILTHTCHNPAVLTLGQELIHETKNNILVEKRCSTTKQPLPKPRQKWVLSMPLNTDIKRILEEFGPRRDAN